MTGYNDFVQDQTLVYLYQVFCAFLKLFCYLLQH